MTVVETLRNCRLFKALDESELDEIAKLSREENYPAGAKVFIVGDAADTLYVLKEGRVSLDVKVQVGSQKPRYATAEVLSVGEAFGLSALVAKYNYTMSASCLEPVKVVAIDGAELRHLIEVHPSLGLEVMKQINAKITERNKETRERLEYFVSTVSHELKAPLAAVESYLQLMLGGFTGELTDKQRGMLERSSVRINELLTLITDLVDSSRMQFGNLIDDADETPLKPIIERAVEDVQPRAREKNIKMRINLPQELPTMRLAAGRMHQVFTNLLSNAVKYTPNGGTVTLRVIESKDQVRVEIADTGIGIPEADLPRIFEEFYRASNVEAKGAGLGLSIAKKIVEAHGGRIWAESPYPPERGKGSRFCVVLNKQLAAQPTAEANQQQPL